MGDSATGKRLAVPARGRLAPVAAAIRRAGAALESLASRRFAVPALAALSLAVYALESVARPLAVGRDFEHYLLYYVQLFDRHPVLPAVMSARTPATPLFIGGLLELGGAAAEIVLALLFAASVLAWAAVARTFGRLPAVLTALALLAYPSYGMLFHELASDSLFCFALSLWALGFVRSARQPSSRRFLVLGLGLALMGLIRPANQVLLLAALFPLVLPVSWRQRLRWTAVFVAAGVLPLAGWAAHNGLRYGTYAVIRGSGEGFPFNRAFITDRIVSPDNGPASRALAQAVQRRLLTEQPYRAYHVTLKQFFSAGSIREHEDLISLSDEVWGWGSAYSKLHDVGVEAVEKHPGTYARGVLGTLWHELTQRRYIPQPASGAASGSSGAGGTVVVEGRRLPAPTEGEPIPGTHQPDIYTTPDRSVRVVWTSPTESKVVFRNPSDARRYRATMRELGELDGRIPWHDGSGELAIRFNQATHRYPSPLWWLAAGLLLAAIRRPRGIGLLLVLVGLGALLVIFTALALSSEIAYLIPFFPALIALVMAGLFGRAEEPPRFPWRRRSAAPEQGLGLGPPRGPAAVSAIHFWLPEVPPGIEDWDPDLEPRRHADGIGHNVIELYRRLGAMGAAVSLGSDVPRATSLVVLLAGRAVRPQHVGAALRAVARARGRFALIRSDERTFGSFPVRPLVEYMPNQSSVVQPWQQWIPPLPQRGLRPRDPARYGRIASLALKGYPENVPDELLTAEWSRALEARGIACWLDVPWTPERPEQAWHDFSAVDVALCLRNPRMRLDIVRKPATRLINSWVAGCIPIADPEPAYVELGREEQDVFFVQSVWASLDVIDRLNADPQLLAGVEQAVRERGRAFSTELIVARWQESLEEAASTCERQGWRQATVTARVAEARAARSRVLSPALQAVRRARLALHLRTSTKRAIRRLTHRD